MKSQAARNKLFKAMLRLEEQLNEYSLRVKDVMTDIRHDGLMRAAEFDRIEGKIDRARQLVYAAADEAKDAVLYENERIPR